MGTSKKKNLSKRFKINQNAKVASFRGIQGTRYKGLKGVAWSLVSRYIRDRDGYRCVTCNERNPNIMQAGHYQPAGYVGTNNKLSFDEYNIHCQCVRCNEFGEGRQEEMGLYIERKYGKEKRDELRSRAHKVDPVEDWEDIIEYYAKKLKLI